MQSLIDWFDCIELTSMRSEAATVIQRGGDTKRDRLFFTLPGIPGFEEKIPESAKGQTLNSDVTFSQRLGW